SLALLADGTVMAWGSNVAGQLGDGTYDDQVLPVQVAGLSDARSIVASVFASAALHADGSIAAWGESGEVGDGSDGTQPYPDEDGVGDACAPKKDVVCPAGSVPFDLAGDGFIETCSMPGPGMHAPGVPWPNLFEVSPARPTAGGAYLVGDDVLFSVLGNWTGG